MKCKCVQVELIGKGHCLIVIPRGERQHYTYEHYQYYANGVRTVIGNIVATPVIMNAGAHAIFGTSWSPDEGILLLNISPHVEDVILRVMDHNRVLGDSVIGEVKANLYQIVDEGVVTLPLTKNGKETTGMIEFSMNWDSNSDTRKSSREKLKRLKIQVYEAVGLSNASVLGTNHVFVQAYVKPEGTHNQSGKSFPSPSTNVILPVTSMEQPLTFPFEFTLPSNLPSSMVESSQSYVAYSILSTIVTEKKNLTTRTFFSVMQPTPSYQKMKPLNHFWQLSLYAQCCIPPFSCYWDCTVPCGSSLGPMKVTVSAERSSYAPGEQVDLTIDYSCDGWEDFENRIKSITIELQHDLKIWTDDFSFIRRNTVMNKMTIPKGQKTFSFIVPPVPPTYKGGLGRYEEPDPLTWKYFLKLEIAMNLPGITMGATKFPILIPFVVSGLNLNAFPPPEGFQSQQRSNSREWTGKNAPVKTTRMKRDYRVIPTNEDSFNTEQESSKDESVDTRVATLFPQLLSQCVVVPGVYCPQLIRDAEDANTMNPNNLMHAPAYVFFNPPAFNSQIPIVHAQLIS